MRWLKLSILAAVLGFTVWGAAKDEMVADLKARIEAARPEDRPPLCIHVAERQLQNADRLYTEGNVEQARAAVEDVATYSEKARDSAAQSKKHLKAVEIAVRKMAEKLRDIKRTLNLEDQPPVDDAIKRLEDVRTSLLDAMFRREKK
jgi:soluble cytochrome b562